MVKLRTRKWNLMVSSYMARRSPSFCERAPRSAPSDQWKMYCDWVYAYGNDCEARPSVDAPTAAHDLRLQASPSVGVVETLRLDTKDVGAVA